MHSKYNPKKIKCNKRYNIDDSVWCIKIANFKEYDEPYAICIDINLEVFIIKLKKLVKSKRLVWVA